MKKNLLILFVLLLNLNVFSQNSLCNIGAGCSDSPLNFPNTFNNGNAENGPDYGCLTEQPNPAWYFLGIDQSGDIEITISQVDINGNPIDVDFICYGPFSDPNIACNNTSILNASTIIDCSYLPDDTEYLSIPNVQSDEFYILLITNYANTEGSITMTQTNQNDPNSGSTDCSYACSVHLENDINICLNNNYTLTTELGNASMEDSATYKWFKNNDSTPIPGATSSTYNIIGSNSITTDIYKVEVIADLCEDIASDEITVHYVDVTSNLKLTNISAIQNCDIDGNNDGLSIFDLTTIEDEIANTENANDYTFLYYTDSALTQLINNPSNFQNSSNNQTIFISITHNTFIGCESIAEFKLEAFDTPTATQLDDWLYCDDNNDGFYEFDLASLLTNIYNGQDILKYSISFHKTISDAEGNINALPLTYTNNTAYQDENIYIRIENKLNSSCYDISNFTIRVLGAPIANQINDWIVCDNQDNDGFYEFDFSLLYSDLLNGQDPNEITLSFYQSLVDAEYKIKPYDIIYTNNNNFTEEEIFVRLENLEGCVNFTSFYINVIKTPIFDVDEDTKYICTNLLPQTVIFKIKNAQDNYSYSWKDENGNELSATSSLNATQQGDYTITATTLDGNDCNTTKTVHLLPAVPAEILDISIYEYYQNDNFTIDINISGTGVYQFSLDEVNDFQNSPTIINIKPGVHTIYVKEMNGCGIISKEINLFGFRPYFSPNGDGKHDIWKVQGINFNPLAKIHIFDRYGKLMAQIYPERNEGWDGFVNGKPAPEGEYWFIAEITNNKQDNIIRKGHFSLIRTKI